ncbi:intraflagellar transport protein 88 homolog [Selaginella moellendorffii]|uniref:intraflagellar transport protein 88 homolog n=1 Tax=Selaginella moellendorffii TaxID=88036 RepID=UPI000D1CDF15|nr:intraflagellar transport protein 88 homolog [Selaginella moellendorffii]|eukprot:XP_024515999.1 intraflagellar transport protein 88 homolog [Selaginella moellendorffii]
MAASSCSARGFRDVRYNELYEGYNDYDEQIRFLTARPQRGGKALSPPDFFNLDHTRTPTPQNALYYRPPSVGRARSVSSSSLTAFDRPMTAVRAAGYTSRGTKFDPLNQGARLTNAQKRDELNPEYQVRELESQVNQMLEESATASFLGQYATALEKAKEAGKRERKLCKHREQTGLADQVNTELTFAVCFNLGYQYEMNRLHSEALNTYSQIVKSKQFPQGGRLRVNMGNIYYEQEKYALAVKMYRMALDQTPNSYKDTRYKIMRNIGISLMRTGHYQDAVQSFESLIDITVDHHAAYNLLVSHYVLGNCSKMRSCFTKMLLVKHYDPERDDDIEPDHTAVFRRDELRQELHARQNQANRLILTSARIIAPVVGNSLVEGYDWVIELLQDQQYVTLAHEMEMDKALQHLHQRDFQQAIALLKEFERKERDLQARAATNLSFLYFLEGDLANAEKHAELAVLNNRFNACALVNQGNCYFMRGDPERAKQVYKGAADVDPDCVEALYNLGLAYKKLNSFEEALSVFKKISYVLPNNTEVLFQIGQVSDVMGNSRQAIKWLELLVSKVMHDAGLLAMLGNLYVRCEDDAKALHYFSESHRVCPTDVVVTAWLGSFYLQNELYEKAMPFFQLASRIHPDEVKWKLKVALCLRRTGSFSKALHKYKQILNAHPDNAECLHCLVHLCTSLGRKMEVQAYESKLWKVDQDHQRQTGSSMACFGQCPRRVGYDSVKSSGKARDEDWELTDDLLPI